MRKYYWYFSTFFRKHGVILLGSVVAAIVVSWLALPIVIKLLDFHQREYVGVVGSYTLSTLPTTISNKFSAGLTRVEPDGTVVPALAERWNVEDDGKTYRFLLRKGLNWQDGKPLTTEDIKYQFPGVTVITTNNDILFKLEGQYSPFPTVVSQPLIREEFEPYFFFFKHPKVIGLGTYRVTSITEQDARVKELTLTGKSDQTIYRFYLTENDAIEAFKRGEVDTIQDLSSPGDLTDWETVEIRQHLAPQRYLAVFFNTSTPIFSSNQVRQALNYATEKPTDDTRAVGPISSNSWAFADVGKHYDFDMERALERLLDDINNTVNPLSFELVTTPHFNREAEVLKASWEKLGQEAVKRCNSDTKIKSKNNCPNLAITVHIRLNNFPDLSNYQAVLIGQESPSDPDQYSLWHSSERTNFTNYRNTRIDSLLEKGRQTTNLQQRREIYQDFQQFFLEDAPVIFIRHLLMYDVIRR